MNSKTKLSLAVLAALAGISPLANAEEQSEGFIEGSSLTVLNRNFYFNRDNRNGENGAGGAGYSEAWAHGIIGKFESGFTQGTVGFGVDAFAMIGIKLDTGGGRNGARSSFDVLPVNSEVRLVTSTPRLGAPLRSRHSIPRSRWATSSP